MNEADTSTKPDELPTQPTPGEDSTANEHQGDTLENPKQTEDADEDPEAVDDLVSQVQDRLKELEEAQSESKSTTDGRTLSDHESEELEQAQSKLTSAIYNSHLSPPQERATINRIGAGPKPRQDTLVSLQLSVSALTLSALAIIFAIAKNVLSLIVCFVFVLLLLGVGMLYIVRQRRVFVRDEAVDEILKMRIASSFQCKEMSSPRPSDTQSHLTTAEESPARTKIYRASKKLVPAVALLGSFLTIIRIRTRD